MTISTTSVFNPDIAEIAEEAFENCGLEMRTGNDMRTVRRSLNYLALEWQNKGINLWTIEEQTIASSVIAAGTPTYNIDIDTISILDAVIRTDDADVDLQNDIVINRMSSTTYSQLPGKLTTGRPVQYWFNRIGVRNVTSSTDRNSTVTFWPVPDTSNKYTFVYWRMRRIADFSGSAANTSDVPDRFIPALAAGLSWKIAIKRAPARTEYLKSIYDSVFLEATQEDREKEDFIIHPNLSGYGIGSQ